MVYYVFDLDATLADVGVCHYFLCDLRTVRFMEDGAPGTRLEVSEKYNTLFDNAYKEFLRLVLAAEMSSGDGDRLGVLRPGIIDVFRVIKAQRDAGTCKGVMIYSNNMFRCALEFVRDLLELAVGGAVICECVARNHPDRWEEADDLYGDSTVPKKTWSVMTRILTNGACRASSFSLKPAEVRFFDDQVHPDLVEILGPVGNYIQVTPHYSPTKFDTMAKIYIEALIHAGVLNDGNSDVYTMFQQNVAICDPDFKKRGRIEEHVAAYRRLTPPPFEGVVNVDAEAILRAVKRIETGGSKGGRKRRNSLKVHRTQNGSGTQNGSRVQGPRKSRRNHR